MSGSKFEHLDYTTKKKGGNIVRWIQGIARTKTKSSSSLTIWKPAYETEKHD